MAETDLVKLYSPRILALAANIPRAGRLEHADASARRRSPLCGSNVTVDLVLKDGRIVDYSQDVKACALGQASASVVGAHIIGCDRAQVQRARDELFALLKKDGPTPSAPFEDLEMLRPARAFGNRHASIMLALDATLEAMDQAGAVA